MRRGALSLAFVASGGVHLALAGAWPTPDVVIEGGDVAGEVALGSSFADLVAGTLEVSAADDVMQPSQTATRTNAVRSETIARPAPLEQTVATNATDPVHTTANQYASPERTESVAVAASPSVASSPSPMAVTTSTDAHLPRTVAPSIRPSARPERSVPQPAPTPEPQQPARRGNADVSAAAGQRNGSEEGTAAQSSGAEQTSARQVGQGEINDYASRVVSRITRVAERMRSRGNEGRVIVGLEIAANGGLARVAVSQSSGNPTADAIALDAVRRAAPFDPTPTGRNMPVRFAVQFVSQ